MGSPAQDQLTNLGLGRIGASWTLSFLEKFNTFYKVGDRQLCESCPGRRTLQKHLF